MTDGLRNCMKRGLPLPLLLPLFPPPPPPPPSVAATPAPRTQHQRKKLRSRHGNSLIRIPAKHSLARQTMRRRREEEGVGIGREKGGEKREGGRSR